MKNVNRILNSGVLLFVFALLCAVLGVTDASAMTADAFPIPVEGDGTAGVADFGRNGNMETIAREEDEFLLLDGTDEKVIKIKKYPYVLDALSRHASASVSVKSRRHHAFELGYLPTTASLTTAIAAGVTSATLATSNDKIFISEQCIKVDGVQGYAEDGVTETPNQMLQLYVLSKDQNTGALTVIACNGTGPDRNVFPDIPAGTLLHGMATAGSEDQMRSDNIAAYPTDKEFFLQKCMVSVKVTTKYQIIEKRVNWELSDIQENAVQELHRRMNMQMWVGAKSVIKAKNGNSNDVSDIYFMGGIWGQAANDFDTGDLFDVDVLGDLLEMSFTLNDSSTEKFFIAGSSKIKQLENIDYTNRLIREGDTKTALGIVVTKLISKFGTLLVVHDRSLDDIGMKDNAFVLDPAYLKKYTMGMHVKKHDLRAAAISDADSIIIWEECCLGLMAPQSHVRVS